VGRIELQPMVAVVDPDARRADELARADDGGVAGDDHEVALPPRLDPQDTEAVFGVVVGDTLEHPRERLGRCSHDGPRRLPQSGYSWVRWQFARGYIFA
jgi:hypothetical protein